MKRLPFFSITSLLIFGVGCAHNPYSNVMQVADRYDAYEHYRPTPVQLARMRANYEKTGSGSDNPFLSYTVTDLDMVNYADHVQSIMTSKFTAARFARYTSSTTQVLLAAGAGIAAAFTAGTATIAALAFGSAATPKVGEVFNAKARAGYYRVAALQIDDALREFGDNNPYKGRPSDKVLTKEGRKLGYAVAAAIEKVELAMDEDLPALKSAADAEKLSVEMQEQFKSLNKRVSDLQDEIRDAKKKAKDTDVEKKKDTTGGGAVHSGTATKITSSGTTALGGLGETISIEENIPKDEILQKIVKLPNSEAAKPIYEAFQAKGKPASSSSPDFRIRLQALVADINDPKVLAQINAALGTVNP